jgi:sodium-dependent dicarboxylate transporter 2/3/5
MPTTINEPEARPTAPDRRPRRILLLGLALLAALVASRLAPTPWPEDGARLRVSYREDVAIDEPAPLDATPFSLGGAAANTTITFAAPDGLTPDAPIEAQLQVLVGGAPIRPALADLEVKLALADGRDELIPPARWDPDTQALVVTRRPPVDANLVLALLALVVILWVSEALPLFVTALIVPVFLATVGVQTATQALSPFFHPIIALFFGGFLMAEAMRRVGLDHLVAINLVARFGRSPATLFAAMVAVAAFLSMWMSNTASAAVLVPIALAVTRPFEDATGLRYRRALVLGIAYAATIGGVGSAIGTPANPLAIEFLEQFAGREITFVGWFAFGLPMVILFLPLMAAYLWWRLGAAVDHIRFAEARRVATSQLAVAGPPTRDQLAVLAVFVGVILVWLTQQWHDIETGIVALAGAIVLAILGYVRQDDLSRISWPSLLTFGGGLALGVALVDSGTADWVAAGLAVFESLPPIVALAAVAFLALALTTVASNTASAAMIIPLAIPLAGVLDLDPVLLVVTVAIASSVDFALVIGTPPTMIAYSTELFTAPQIFRVGAVLDLLGMLLLVLGVATLWQLAGLV